MALLLRSEKVITAASAFMMMGAILKPLRQRIAEFQTQYPFPACTLTAANNVIHLDRWWNPAVEDQCKDRVYRIGQTKAVQVSLPIARHPDPQLAETSFDLTLDRLMQRKRTQSRDLLNPAAMSDKDTADLFGDVCGELTQTKAKDGGPSGPDLPSCNSRAMR